MVNPGCDYRCRTLAETRTPKWVLAIATPFLAGQTMPAAPTARLSGSYPVFWLSGKLAGVAGFEPAHADTKNRCLTAWLHPNNGPQSREFDRPRQAL